MRTIRLVTLLLICTALGCQERPKPRTVEMPGARQKVQESQAKYPLNREFSGSLGSEALRVTLSHKVTQKGEEYFYWYKITCSGTSKDTCFVNWAVLDKVIGNGGTSLFELKSGEQYEYTLRSKEYPTELRSGALLLRVFTKGNLEDAHLRSVGTTQHQSTSWWPSMASTQFGPIPPSMADKKKRAQ